MGEERPLTEFTDGVQDTETTPDRKDTETTGDGSDPDTADADDAALETEDQATITYRWRPDGAECAQCGASSEKQWLDGGEFVCPDCKSWK